MSFAKNQSQQISLFDATTKCGILTVFHKTFFSFIPISITKKDFCQTFYRTGAIFLKFIINDIEKRNRSPMVQTAKDELFKFNHTLTGIKVFNHSCNCL